jgi:hypothetical protein
MRELKGYLTSNVSAGLCFFVLFSVQSMFEARSYQINTVLFILFGCVSILTTLLPFSFAIQLAASLQLRTRIYFCSVGLIVSISYAAALATILSHFHGWYTDPDNYVPPSFSACFGQICPALAAAGLIGGYTYWRVAGRYIGSPSFNGAARIALSSSK